MSITIPTSTGRATAPRGPATSTRGRVRGLGRPVPVLVLCLLAGAAFVADAVSGRGDRGLAGVALLALALWLTLREAVRVRAGRPWRSSRVAATTGAAASLFVAAFLSSVGVLERMGPQVTGSVGFAAGVAVMSVVLLVVLPLALGAFAWAAWRDRRLDGRTRCMPLALLLVLTGSGVTVAVTAGTVERWACVAAVALCGGVLTRLSAGLSRAPGRPG